MKDAVVAGYSVAALVTAAYLTLIDFAALSFWNWAIIIPVNLFLGAIWPIYWAVIRPILGI